MFYFSVFMKKNIFYVLFFLTFGIVFYLWWATSSALLTGTSTDVYLSLGRLAGLFFQYFILLQLILIGRITWIEKQFGHDELNKLHRWVGTGTLTFLVFHPVFLILAYSRMLEITFLQQLVAFLGGDDIFGAFLAVLILLLAIALSMPFIRRKVRYEIWYISHLFIYLAIFLAFEHQFSGGDLRTVGATLYWYAYNYLVFGLLAYYRFIRPIYNSFVHQFVVEKVVQESKDVYSVYITGKNMERFRFLPGQFAHFFFLGKGFWFAHPFSFSALPNGETIRITVKSLGDFTGRVKDMKPGTRVLIDGPLGRFVEVHPEQKKYLLIAGGIGITPIFSLFQSFDTKQKDVAFLYSNRTKDDIIFEKQISSLNGKKFLFLSDCPEKISGYEQGKIDKEKIANLISDVKEREVYICGPAPMMKAIAQALHELGLPKSRIHYEKFAY